MPSDAAAPPVQDLACCVGSCRVTADATSLKENPERNRGKAVRALLESRLSESFHTTLPDIRIGTSGLCLNRTPTIH